MVTGPSSPGLAPLGLSRLGLSPMGLSPMGVSPLGDLARRALPRDLARRALPRDRIGLAVTGLSRSGKTVFITSLVQNLLALGQGLNTLPALAARLQGDGESRLVGVEVLPAGASDVPHFDLAAKRAALAADSPAWPGRTQDVATISLRLTIARPSGLGRRIGPRTLRLDILDYPGEWLLDLPLLGQDFGTWSREALALLRDPARADLAAPFLTFLERQRGTARVEERLAREGHALYRQALERCRSERGLRFLQPGRFLCPGPRGDLPLMWFYPDDTPGSTLAERFEAYKAMVRSEFVAPYFAGFHRQVVLVDVLGALVAGQAAFEDTTRALRAIAGALRYGSTGLLPAAASLALRGLTHVVPPALGRPTRAAADRLGDPRIERVCFVATKADHVPALKRDNLRHLLVAMAGQAVTAEATHLVAAALASTQDGVARRDGRAVPVVNGVVMGEDRVRPFDVGEVPSALPPDSFWSDRFFELPVFRPPAIDPTGAAGMPHLGLDEVLVAAIGDLLA